MGTYAVRGLGRHELRLSCNLGRRLMPGLTVIEDAVDAHAATSRRLPSDEAAHRARWLAPGNLSLLIEVASLVVAVPFLLMPSLGGGWPAMVVALCLLAIAGSRTLQAMVQRRGATALLVPSLLIGAMALVSLSVSIDPVASLRKVYGLFLGIVLYSLLVRTIAATEALQTVWRLYAFSGAGIALVGIVGVDWSATKAPVLTGVYSLLGAVARPLLASLRQAADINPNEVGGVLVLMWPPILILAVQSYTNRRHGILLDRIILAIDGTVACLVGSVLLLTLSRSAMAGAAIASGLLMMAWYHQAGRRPRLIFAFVGGGGLAVIAAAATIWGGRLFDNVGPNLAPQRWLEHFAVRIELWQRAVFMVQDFPFTGIGVNTFPIVVGTLYPLILSSGDARPPPHAHNFLLQVAVDFGIPGLLAWLWLLGTVGRILYRAWRSPPSAARLLAVGLTAGLTGHMVYGLTDAVALGAKAGIALWWTLGLSEAAWHVIGSGNTVPLLSHLRIRDDE
jgi:putative inorganic carbon (hco3(-)) transporter